MLVNTINNIKNSGIYRKVSHATQNVAQQAFNTLPTETVKGEKTLKTLDWLGKEVSSAENRLILGVTAIMSQPFIDFANKDVDEKTRKVSVARTCAKIIAGTLTGVLIRKGCIYAAKNFTKVGTEKIVNGVKKPLSKLDNLLTPDNAQEGQKLKDYTSAMGTLLALGVMTITNFAIDAPLTKFLTNLFISKDDNTQKSGGAK